MNMQILNCRFAAPLFLLFYGAALLPASPVHILCVGDSITQGGKRDRQEYTYRLPLQKKLHDAGIAYDFIGTQNKGLHEDAVWPEVAPGVPFDPDHNGYYGNTTADAVCKTMAAWKDDMPAPDIVLIHLGTNDQKKLPHTETVQKPLREFIAFLRTKNPSVVVLLGHLNFNGSEGATDIRKYVQALADELNTPESPVRTVAHYEGWHEKPGDADSDTFDWAHPNPKGQEKMADKWLAAMKPFLPAPVKVTP